MSDIGINIKNIRKSVGLRQKDLAASVGISSQHLCGIEAGKVEVSIKVLNLVALKLNKDIIDILKYGG